MPSRGLHLPRLKADVAWRTGAAAGAIALAAALGAFLLVDRTTRVPDATARRAVALFLYGQADPDDIRAAGLHGLGGRSIPIRLTQVGACRFRVASPESYDEIDFDRISEIRFALVPDPAAGLVAAVGPQRPSSRRSIPDLALLQIAGADDAVCDPAACAGHRAFALDDAAHLEMARIAAADFRARLCRGS